MPEAKRVTSVLMPLGPRWRGRRLRPVRGFYGVRDCAICRKPFDAEWPGSKYCPTCPAPGHCEVKDRRRRC